MLIIANLTTAWKIRFDGFGRSDYSDPTAKEKDVRENICGWLKGKSIPIDTLAAPPFYQPQGASHVGGTFAISSTKEPEAEDASKVGKDKAPSFIPADREHSVSKGCSIH